MTTQYRVRKRYTVVGGWTKEALDRARERTQEASTASAARSRHLAEASEGQPAAIIGAPRFMRRATRREWWLTAAGFLVILALSVGYSLTRVPWWDEGIFADVAVTFRNHGHLGSLILYPYGYLEWPKADQYTYWQFPLYLVSLAAWFHLVPASIEWIRIFSVAWGGVYIACWFLIARSLNRDEVLALFLAVTMGLDYSFIAASSNGRMDMMCAALGVAALAAYVCIRDVNWNRAVVLSAVFGAASLFCHPMGCLMNVVIAALVCLDWRRIRLSGLAAALVPYLIGLGLYLHYILKAPDVFLAQTRAASAYRISGFWPVLQNVGNDLQLRYFGLYYTFVHGTNKLKVASLAFAITGTTALLLSRRLRSDALGRLLLLTVFIGTVGVAVIDNQKFPIYFVYTMPVMTGCGALWVYQTWQNRSPLRWFAGCLLVASLLATIGGFGYKILKNDFDRLYRPVITVVRRFAPPGGLVMGGAELAFELGSGARLCDDRYLGYFSGLTPDVFVENLYYGGMPGRHLSEASRVSRTRLATSYRLAFENQAYRVYVRKHPAGSTAPPK